MTSRIFILKTCIIFLDHINLSKVNYDRNNCNTICVSCLLQQSICIRMLYPYLKLSYLKRVSFAKLVKIGISTKLGILFKATNSLNKFLPDLCWGNSYSLNPFIPAPADECPSKSSRVLLQSLSTLTPIYQHLNEVISWINFSLVGSLSVECFSHPSQWFANTFFHCHMH